MSTVLTTRPNSQTPIGTLQQKSDAGLSAKQRDSLIELMKSMYQAEHQVEFLHLQAEADTLIQELRTLTSKRKIVDRS